jgi:hypothetical protein
MFWIYSPCNIGGLTSAFDDYCLQKMEAEIILKLWWRQYVAPKWWLIPLILFCV